MQVLTDSRPFQSKLLLSSYSVGTRRAGEMPAYENFWKYLYLKLEITHRQSSSWPCWFLPNQNQSSNCFKDFQNPKDIAGPSNGGPQWSAGAWPLYLKCTFGCTKCSPKFNMLGPQQVSWMHGELVCSQYMRGIFYGQSSENIASSQTLRVL